MSDKDRTYNGWSSYESWAVALWLDNEEGSYNLMREWARECTDEAPSHENVARIPSIWTRAEAAKFTLADRIKEYIEEQAPDLGATLYTDLLNAALSEVDWYEVAEHYLSDLEEDEKDANA